MKVCDPKKQGKRLSAGALGFLDEFAEFDQPAFVSWEHVTVFFEGFEDEQGAGEVVKIPMGDEEVTLEVGAVGFGVSEVFANGERFLEIGLGYFDLAEVSGEIAELAVGNGKVTLEVGLVGFGLGDGFADSEDSWK